MKFFALIGLFLSVLNSNAWATEPTHYPINDPKVQQTLDEVTTWLQLRPLDCDTTLAGIKRLEAKIDFQRAHESVFPRETIIASITSKSGDLVLIVRNPLARMVTPEFKSTNGTLIAPSQITEIPPISIMVVAPMPLDLHTQSNEWRSVTQTNFKKYSDAAFEAVKQLGLNVGEYPINSVGGLWMEGQRHQFNITHINIELRTVRSHGVEGIQQIVNAVIQQ